MAASMCQRRHENNKPEKCCFLLIILFTNLVLSSVKCHKMFAPADVLSSVDNACLVLLTEFSNMDTSNVFDELALKTFIDEPLVMFGLVGVTSFTWPNGNILTVQSTSQSGNAEVIIFERIFPDRTCLLMKRSHSAVRPIVYSGLINRESLIDFINTECHTYRASDGRLTIEGYHSKEILNSLFSVAQISDVSMDDLSGKKSGTEAQSILQKMNTYNEQEEITHGFKTSDADMIDITHAHESCPIGKSMDSSVSDTCDESNYDFLKVHNDKEIPQCERITAPSIQQFFHEYLKISKPVIIKNITKSWPAFQKWTNEYFKTEYGDHDVYIKLTPRGEFEGVEKADLWENYNSFSIPHEVKLQLQYPELVVVRPASLNLKFSDFIDMIENVTSGNLRNVSAYLEYSSIRQHLPDLEEDIKEMPFIRPGIHKLEHLNIWLSDGNTLGKLHFDPYDNFLCQIHGQKEVMLFDPQKNENLYEAHIPEAILYYNKTTGEFRRRTLVDSTSMVMSPVDILKPDFEKFPRFASAMPLNCTLMEGDVLFMPSFWWHEVQSSPSHTARHNLAVNFWYDPFLTKEFPCPNCRLDINQRYRHIL